MSHPQYRIIKHTCNTAQHNKYHSCSTHPLIHSYSPHTHNMITFIAYTHIHLHTYNSNYTMYNHSEVSNRTLNPTQPIVMCIVR